MAKICDIHLCVCDVYVISQDEENKAGPEKLEEAKLKAKYPHLGNKPGGSDLLRKRLQKGVRFIHTLLLPPILVGWIAVLEEKIQITGLWWFYTGSRTSASCESWATDGISIARQQTQVLVSLRTLNSVIDKH